MRNNNWENIRKKAKMLSYCFTGEHLMKTIFNKKKKQES